MQYYCIDLKIDHRLHRLLEPSTKYVNTSPGLEHIHVISVTELHSNARPNFLLTIYTHNYRHSYRLPEIMARSTTLMIKYMRKSKAILWHAHTSYLA